jgi:hypothetical protein
LNETVLKKKLREGTLPNNDVMPFSGLHSTDSWGKNVAQALGEARGKSLDLSHP